MKKDIFQKLISRLLSLPVIEVSDINKDLQYFEDKYCFNQKLQPLYTKDALIFLFSSAKEKIFYEITDQIGVCISFFIYEKRRYIIGPYVKNEYNSSFLEELLIRNQLPASMLLSMRLYYLSIPIAFFNQIEKTIISTLGALYDKDVVFEYRQLSGFISDKAIDIAHENQTNNTNYSEIYMRYDTENQFLNMIKNGDIHNVTYAFKNMSNSNFTLNMAKEMQGYYQSASSFSILMALSRKAAEQGGLSVIKVNEISQKYVQIFSASENSKNHIHIVNDMILELTEAVHKAKLSYENFSLPVQKVIKYIDFYLNQELPVSILAKEAGLSISRLSKIFKEEVNETLTVYIAHKRCEKAGQLLKETDLPISEIANFVGYADNNYFVKVFKKVYQMTPSEYRKKMLSFISST